MVLLYVYRPSSDTFETCMISGGEAMPFAPGLSFRSFLGMSESVLAWTDERLLRQYDRLCALCPKPPRVRYGFRRVGEGAHTGQSAHHAGLALDIALGREDWMTLAKRAVAAGFYLPEAAWMTPTWLHVETQMERAFRGYPRLMPGAKGVHAFVLQDALTRAGLYYGGLNGIVTPSVETAVRRFQKSAGLPITGAVCAETWKKLMDMAHARRARKED